MYGLRPASLAGASVPAAESPDAASPVLPDTVQMLAWGPGAAAPDYLASASWDGKVRIWQAARSAAGGACSAVNIQMELDYGGPALGVDWKDDASAVFGGGTSCVVRAWDIRTKAATDIGKHDAPVRHVHWVKERAVAVTGSWDKSVRFWDMRSPTAALALPMAERVYSMDVKYPLMVVALANRQILLFDLSTNPQVPLRTMESPLRLQTRCVRAFHDRAYFGVTSIEGRCAIRCVDARLEEVKDAEGKTLHHFAFKCHRENLLVHAANFVDNHPAADWKTVFSTVGGDGVINFWDKDKRTRLRELKVARYPVTCGVWNATGDLFAYSIGYDWSQGVEGNNAAEKPPKVCVHHTTVAGDLARPVRK